MNCPGCGAPTTQEMLEEGECGYCHAALVRPAKPEAPKIVNVTRVELHAPAVGDLADGVSTRVFGCASGCVSLGMTAGITGMILAFVGYQLWVATHQMPSPAPAPVHVSPSPSPRSAPAPAPRSAPKDRTRRH